MVVLVVEVVHFKWSGTTGAGGTGNTPVTSPSQGNNGGSSSTDGSFRVVQEEEVVLVQLVEMAQ
jgi:hypothetical protein